jgi:hypothetical protein
MTKEELEELGQIITSGAGRSGAGRNVLAGYVPALLRERKLLVEALRLEIASRGKSHAYGCVGNGALEHCIVCRSVLKTDAALAAAEQPTEPKEQRK